MVPEHENKLKSAWLPYCAKCDKIVDGIAFPNPVTTSLDEPMKYIVTCHGCTEEHTIGKYLAYGLARKHQRFPTAFKT